MAQLAQQIEGGLAHVSASLRVGSRRRGSGVVDARFRKDGGSASSDHAAIKQADKARRTPETLDKTKLREQKFMLESQEFSNEALCRSILERHRDTITVQKPEFAIRKLTVIVTAALDVSNSKGFHAMSLRDLSKASGVSMGGLYAYFDSKTTLLRMILGEVTAQVQQVLSDPPDQISADPVAYLNWLIEAHISLTERMLPWFTFAFMEAKNFPPSERRMAVDSEALTEAFFARAINSGIAEGRFRPDTSPLLASLIKPLLQDWYVKRSKYRRRDVSIDDYITAVQNLVLDACLLDARPPV